MHKLVITLLAVLSTMTIKAEAGIFAFAGSTREDSINKKLVYEAAYLAAEVGENLEVIDLKNYPIPFYDSDLESKEGLPVNAKKIRQMMIRNNCIIIASPEYNGSITAVLKNVLDWASRSETGGPSREAFKGKTFIIMSATPGAAGGVRGLIHLKEIIENIGGTVFFDQITLGNAFKAFDEEGHLKDSKLKDKIKEIIRSANQ